MSSKRKHTDDSTDRQNQQFEDEARDKVKKYGEILMGKLLADRPPPVLPNSTFGQFTADHILAVKRPLPAGISEEDVARFYDQRKAQMRAFIVDYRDRALDLNGFNGWTNVGNKAVYKKWTIIWHPDRVEPAHRQLTTDIMARAIHWRDMWVEAQQGGQAIPFGWDVVENELVAASELVHLEESREQTKATADHKTELEQVKHQMIRKYEKKLRGQGGVVDNSSDSDDKEDDYANAHAKRRAD